MLSLSVDLTKRCRDVLLKCDTFDSDGALKSFFRVDSLNHLYYALPQANSPKDRVEKLMKFLLDHEERPGYSMLLPFLEVLWKIDILPEESLHGELKQLCFDIDCAFFLKRISAHPTELNSSSDDCLEVAQCLLKFKHMREKHPVEEMLKLLPVEIAQNIPKNDKDMFYFKDLLQIIQTCFSYSDGLYKLAYALYQKEGDSPEWQALDALLHKINPKVVTYACLLQLQSILTKIALPEQILHKAYRVSIPAGWIQLRVNRSTDPLSSLIENLALVPSQSDDTFPIMVFAQYIAHYAQKFQEVSIQNALSAWISKRTLELGLSAAQISKLHTKVNAAHFSHDTYYLLITLDPQDKNSFCMQAWFLNSAGNTISEANIEVEPEAVSLDQVPPILNLLLEKCGDYLVDEINKLIIKFVLPDELLDYPVDHWLIKTGAGGKKPREVKLGTRYKVVVGSLERLREKRMRPLWKSKWKELQKFMDGDLVPLDNHMPIWIYNGDKYKTYEGLDAALNDSAVVCLALTFVPLESHVLEATIGAGVPVALWPRRLTDHPTTVDNLFSSFLSLERLSEIPDFIYKQRRAAGKSEDEHHQGHHLTLLWDDPNISPTKNAVQFAMPPTKRGA